MEGLWWLIAIVLFFLFGKNGDNGQFSLQNQRPTDANNLPASTTQNNTNPPSAQPPPWTQSPSCSQQLVPTDPLATPRPVSTMMPVNFTFRAPLAPVSNTRPRVTFGTTSSV